MHIDHHGHHGPDLVLIHGWAMHGGIFHDLAERLAQHARVHVVDLPGHGYSRGDTAFDFEDICERLLHLLPPAIWIGWSLGGQFALRAALRHHPHVQAIGLIATPPRFVKSPSAEFGVDRAVFEQFGHDLRSDYRATLDRFLALEVQGDEHAISGLRTLRARLFERGEPDVEVLEQGLYLLEQNDFSERLSELPCPSLWISGSRDRLVSWQAMAHAAIKARGHHHRVEHAAHAPFLTHLAETAACIETLVRETHNG